MNCRFDNWGRHHRERVRAGKRGLTFLELLIALALSGFLVAAAAQIFVSMVRSIEMTETGPIEIDHMDRLSDFIFYQFKHDRRRRDNPGLAITLERPQGTSIDGLRFDPADPHPLFQTENPLPGQVTAYLVFDREEGLEVIWFWQGPTGDREVRLRRTRLSPFVSEVEFGRWDDNERNWKFERSTDVSRGDELQRPEVLRLSFEFEDQTGERWVYLQPVLSDVLLF